MKVYVLIGKYECDTSSPQCSRDYQALHASMKAAYEEMLRDLDQYKSAFIGAWEATIETSEVCYGWEIHEFEV